MAFYELMNDCFREVPLTTFAEVGIREREHLQKLLRAQIEIVAGDVMIVAEEFCDWEDSNRRIDLLGLDKYANLVVIELKRTEDGGHMELQALRYAAMVSTMTFEKVEEVYAEYLRRLGIERDSRTSILEFLGWEEAGENGFAQEVRIVLVSAEFSKELTTSVMWLNVQGLDIRCVRMRPYADCGRILIDIQQVIPLPEASDYQVKIRNKQDIEKVARQSSKDYTKYDVTLGGVPHLRLSKRTAIFRVVKHLIEGGIKPESIRALNSRFERALREAPGAFGSLGEFLSWKHTQEIQGVEVFDAKRFFCEDDDFILVDGNVWAFSNQWGAQTYDFICKLLQSFPNPTITCTPA